MTGGDTPNIRRTTSAEATGQTEQLIRYAHIILTACGRSMSANRIVRVVRDYQRCVERNGWVFWDFITTAMQLDLERKAQYESDPDIYRTITYHDPTGEMAVRNVMRRTK